MRNCAWLLGGSGAISLPPPPPLPGQILNLDPLRLLRSSQIASDAIWDKLSKQHIIATIITILNFKISGVGGVGGNSG